MACLLPICFCELDYTLSAPASPSVTSISSLPTPGVSLTISRHGSLKNGNFIATQNTRKATGICLSLFCIVISDLFIGKSKVPRRIFCKERIAIAFVIPGKPLSKKKIQY